jgi:hypothetical protein
MSVRSPQGSAITPDHCERFGGCKVAVRLHFHEGGWPPLTALPLYLGLLLRITMKVFRLNRLPLFLAVFYLLMELPTIPAAEVTGFASRVKEPRAQSLAVIVNQANPTENLSFAELRKIFLGERSHWPHGRRITVVMLEEGRPERGAVLREIYKMSEAGYRDHFL